MTQRVDISEYFTRRQSDARYLRSPQTPQSPSLALSGSGVTTTSADQFAYVDLLITPPATPSWAGGVPQYIQAVEVTYSYVQGGVTIYRDVVMTYGSGNVYRVEPLPPGVSAQFSAAVIDYAGQESDFTAPLGVAIPADTLAPAQPFISASLANTGVFIHIDGVAGNLNVINTEPDFDHYELWRGTSASGLLADVVWDANALFSFYGSGANDVNIPTSTNYFYKVAAVDTSGNKNFSIPAGPVSVTSTNVAAPAAVSLVGATAVSNADADVTVSWHPSTDANLSGYRIWRKTRISTPPDVYDSSWTLLGEISALPGTPDPVTFVDNRTISGTFYRYTVTAVNEVGDESVYPTAPEYVSVEALDTSAPDPVPDISVAGRTGGVLVTWTISDSPDVVHYLVNYRLTTNGAWQTDDEAIPGNSYSILGLTASRDDLANQLQVRVIAEDADNNQSTATTYTATYPDLAGYRPADNTIPAAPLTLTYSVGNDGTVVLSWPASTSSDRSGYQVERYDSFDANWEVIANILNDQAGTLNYRVVGLEPFSYRGKQYRFRVRTLDYSGNVSSPNYADNASFESGVLSPWGNGGTVVSTAPRTGSYCLQNNFNTNATQFIPVAPGQTYTLSAYLRENPSDTAGKGKVWWDWYKADKSTLISSVGGTLTQANSSYQRLTVSGKAPANAAFARLQLVGDGSNVTKTILWDDVQFEQGAQANTYADSKTDLINAADITPPADYNTVLTPSNGLGKITLRWLNPGPGYFDYVGSTFEVWRQVTVSSQPDLPVDGALRKIAEVLGNNDGLVNSFDDLDPDEVYNVTATYRLKATDRFGNTSGFLTGTAVGTSLTPDDLNLVTPQNAPGVPTVNGTPSTGLVSTASEQYAYIDINVSGPDAPAGVPANLVQYITAYEFELSYSSLGNTVARRYFLAYSPGNIYRLNPLITGASYTVKVRAIDFLGNPGTWLTYGSPVVAAADPTPPAKPSLANPSFTATAYGCRINLAAINTEPDFSHYILYRRLHGAANSTFASVAHFFSTAFVDQAIPVTADYVYTVTAVDFSGNESGSPTAGTNITLIGPVHLQSDDTPQPAVLSAPTVSQPSPDGTVLITWTAGIEPNINGYRVYRKVVQSDGSDTVPASFPETIGVIATTATTGLQFTDSTADVGVTYRWSVTAENIAGDEGDLSPYSAFLTVADTIAPAQVSNITFIGGLGSIRVSWTPSTSPDARLYRLRYSLDGGVTYSSQVDIEGTTYVVFGLTATRTTLQSSFQVGIITIDTTGNLSSELVSGHPSSTNLANYFPADNTPPAAVTGLTAVTKDDGSVLLSWTSSTAADVSGYYIEKRDSVDSVWDAVATVQDDSSGNTFRIYGLEPYAVRSTTYDFRVWTLDLSGNISTSATTVSSVHVNDTSPPSDYPSLTFVATGMLGAINLTWNNPPKSFVDSKDYINSVFEVWRSATAGTADLATYYTGYTKVAEVPGTNDGAANGWADMTPSEAGPAMTYFYRLVPRDQWGNRNQQIRGNNAAYYVTATSKTYNDDHVLPDGLFPNPPGGFAASSGSEGGQPNGTIVLQWNHPADTGGRLDLAGYKVYRKKSTDSAYTLRATIHATNSTPDDGAGHLNWVDTAVEVGKTYSYYVTSYDLQLEESQTATPILSVTTSDDRIPDAPDKVTGKGTIGGIYLTWDPSDTIGVTDYFITIPAIVSLNQAQQQFTVTGTTAFAPLYGGPNSATAADVNITVQAISPSGNNKSTGTVMDTIAADQMFGYIPIDTVAPSAAANVVISNNQNGAVTVSWDASPSIDAYSYAVEASQETAGSPGVPAGWVAYGVAFAPTTSIFITGLTPTQGVSGLSYQFRVVVTDTAGNKSNYAYSTWIDIIDDNTPPSVPTNVTLQMAPEIPTTSATTAMATLNWSSGGERDLFAFQIAYWKTDLSGGTTYLTVPAVYTSTVIRGLALGTSYSFKVLAVDTSRNTSAFSSVVSGSASAPAPSNNAPGAPTVSVSQVQGSTTTQITVAISCGYGGGSAGPSNSPPAENDLSYHSVRRNTANSEGTEVGTVSVPATTVFGTITNFVQTVSRDTNDYTLYYCARTLDTSGATSPVSNIVSIVVAGTGATGGGGGTGGGGSRCPEIDTYLSAGLQVRDAKVGDLGLVYKNHKLVEMPILSISEPVRQPCVRLESVHLGNSKVVSESTWIEQPDGSQVRAKDADGKLVLVTWPGHLAHGWDNVRVIPVGERLVREISFGGETFAGAEDPAKGYVFTHNASLK